MNSETYRGSVPAIVPSVTSTSRLRRALVGYWHFLETAFAVSRERRHLAALDERALGDIGCSRATADAEASRDFFDVPSHRVRRGRY